MRGSKKVQRWYFGVFFGYFYADMFQSGQMLLKGEHLGPKYGHLSDLKKFYCKNARK